MFAITCLEHIGKGILVFKYLNNIIIIVDILKLFLSRLTKALI